MLITEAPVEQHIFQQLEPTLGDAESRCYFLDDNVVLIHGVLRSLQEIQ